MTGLRHGVFCVGCCWPLMALFFVFGTMNLAAALALTVLVLAEKTLSGGFVIARVASGVLVVVGVATLLQGVSRVTPGKNPYELEIGIIDAADHRATPARRCRRGDGQRASQTYGGLR